MALCKYFEDNYEMFLERIENQNQREVQVQTTVTLSFAPQARTVNPSSQLVHTDYKIKCKDCGEFFTLTYGEQKFYRKHNLCNPKRCKACRDLRKAKAS